MTDMKAMYDAKWQLVFYCTYCHYEVKLIDLLAKNILNAKSNMCSYY